MSGPAGQVVVTGATGFIGSHLVRRLAAEPGVEVFAQSRRATGAAAPGVVAVPGPLEDLTPEAWRAAGLEAADCVFHLGAFTPKSAGDAPVAEVFRSNVEGTRALLGSLPAPPRRLVFASTLDVYAPTDGPIDESSPVGGRDLYAASKLFGEHQVRDFAQRTGCEHAVLRYGHIFGPGEEHYAKLVPIVIRRLLDGQPPTLYGDGSAGRDLLYVGDAVEATVRAATADAGLLDPVNVVRGESVPIRTVVELLVAITGAEVVPEVVAAPPGRSLAFDARRRREALGDWELVPLEEGLRNEVEHMRGLAA